MPSPTNARGAWIAIEENFLGIQERRPAHSTSTPSSASSLRVIFRSTTTASSSKGWSTILAYHRPHLGLERASRPQRALPRYRHPSPPSFPSFASVRNKLLLEKINMADQLVAPLTNLVVMGCLAHQLVTSGGGGSRPPTSKQKKGKSKSMHKSGGNNSAPGGSTNPAGSTSSSLSSTSGPGRQFPSYYNPWTGSIQMWAGPRTPLAQLQHG